MKVSIIIPSFNQGRFLEACIDSILSQNIEGTEIFVFDGGSTDETVEILKSYGNKIFWTSQPDRGQTDAINRGLQKSTGDVLAYLNSDDIYFPGSFARALKHFSENPKCMALYGRCDHLKENGEFMESYNTQQWDYNKLLRECFICQPGTFWRRETMERYGLFDDRLNFCMDYEFWLRVGASCAFHYIDDFVLAGSRLYEDNKTLGQKVPVHKEIVSMVTPIHADAGFHWLRICAHHTFMKEIEQHKGTPLFTSIFSYSLAEAILSVGHELSFPFQRKHFEALQNMISPYLK